MTGIIEWAAEQAAALLSPFSDRWSHTIGVAERARDVGEALSEKDRVLLIAAAYLHDMGGLPPYAIPGVDHGDRGIQVVDTVLREAGFPMEKTALVKEIIDHHQYYRPPDTVAVAILFRDADILDFMGAIDIARIVSLTMREQFTPDLPHAIEVIRRQLNEMPAQLQTAAAKREGQKRALEMQQFLDALAQETDSLRSL